MATVPETAKLMPAKPPGERVPPLQNGDQLTLNEFLRRYEAMPNIHNAQLIEGVVYMPSPVTHTFHGNPHFNFIGWLFSYALWTPGVEGGDNSTLRLDMGNGPQADAYLIVRPSNGGQVRIDADGYIRGGPELVGEISASSASIDLTDKLASYARNGVREYVVWRVYDRAIDWFVQREGRLTPVTPGPDGLYRSTVLPGLWLDWAALVAADLLTVTRAVQQGIATPEHASFLALLAQGGRNGAQS